VGPDDDPFLRRLLLMFADSTGVPMLINTTLRAKGQPMAETPAEALDTLRSTPLHALAMPPYLVRKRSQPEAAA
jgi:carbamoyltransferase